MKTKTFDEIISGKIFDVRDVIARFEELERDKDDDAEFKQIDEFLENVRGRGGDEQWRADWYPLTFVADYHFTDYTHELAEDIFGKEIRDSNWPFNCIDWEDAARELQMDYESVDVDGETYWYR